MSIAQTCNSKFGPVVTQRPSAAQQAQTHSGGSKESPTLKKSVSRKALEAIESGNVFTLRKDRR